MRYPKIDVFLPPFRFFGAFGFGIGFLLPGSPEPDDPGRPKETAFVNNSTVSRGSKEHDYIAFRADLFF